MTVSRAKGLTPFGATSIETFSGIEIDLLNPQPAAFNITDIAVGLGNLCRFSGQVRRFYSVAEHSVLVSDLLGVSGRYDLRLAGLLHDASEAYTGDLTAPMKYVIRLDPMVGKHHFDEVVDGIERAICDQFDLELSDEDHAAIKRADNQALRIEAEALCHSKGNYWSWPDYVTKQLPEGVQWAGGLPPMSAAMLFEQRWEQING
jgi:hypothetical protein